MHTQVLAGDETLYSRKKNTVSVQALFADSHLAFLTTPLDLDLDPQVLENKCATNTQPDVQARTLSHFVSILAFHMLYLVDASTPPMHINAHLAVSIQSAVPRPA